VFDFAAVPLLLAGMSFINPADDAEHGEDDRQDDEAGQDSVEGGGAHYGKSLMRPRAAMIVWVKLIGLAGAGKQ
jgi:hypothetical protein